MIADPLESESVDKWLGKPEVEKQTAGRSMMTSNVTLHSLPSAKFRLDGGAMFGVVPMPLWLDRYPVDELNRIELTTRTLLYRCGTRSVLIDPGIGSAWDPALIDRYGIRERDEALGASLAENGLSYDTITDVFLTHLHFDHVGGCFYLDESGGLQLRFPNAMHHVSRRQWEWANHPSDKDRGSYMKQHLELLRSSDRLGLHDSGWELLPGFESFEVDGHTEGQQLFRIFIGGRTWVYGGDLFALADHLRLPWIMAYDIKPLETIGAKKRVLREYLSSGEWLLLGHDLRTVGGQVTGANKRPKLANVIFENRGVQLLDTE